MAGIYEIKVVSYWVNFNPNHLEYIIGKAIKKEQEKNEIKVSVTQIG